jgi:hypothetical protein
MGTMRLQRRRHTPISDRLRAMAARVARLEYDPGLATRILTLSTLASFKETPLLHVAPLITI